MRLASFTRLAEMLFVPRNGLAVFSGVLFLMYGIIPCLVYLFVTRDINFLLLSAVTSVVLASMWLGTAIPAFDHRFSANGVRIVLDSRLFVTIVWAIFVLFVVVTLATAPSIPIVSALKGASAEALSEERGAFLKGREGAGVALLYLSTILVNTVVPYSVVLMFAWKWRSRYLFAALFFLYCISFMQKALFLNLMLPLLAYAAAMGRLRGNVGVAALVGPAVLLLVATALSFDSFVTTTPFSLAHYISASYLPTSALDYFVWRAFAVPIFTAVDTLVVHGGQFSRELLLGSTSSLLALVTNSERINLERIVFEYQFGSWNEIANANAVFIADSFVNFGWFGAVLFGLCTGQIFRWFRISSDIGFRSLWPLFAFVLFSAPLIGMLLSNGFLYILFHALLIRVKEHDASKAHPAGGAKDYEES